MYATKTGPRHVTEELAPSSVVHIRILLERVYPLDMILIFCYMHREGFF
jgi:hypothetical protein